QDQEVGGRVRQVRDLVKYAYDDSELVRDSRKELRRLARETGWLVDHQVEPFAGIWPDDQKRRVVETGAFGDGMTRSLTKGRAFTYDDIPLLQSIAEIEVSDRGPGCLSTFDHKTFFHGDHAGGHH